jgi:hypothetical protein
MICFYISFDKNLWYQAESVIFHGYEYNFIKSSKWFRHLNKLIKSKRYCLCIKGFSFGMGIDT